MAKYKRVGGGRYDVYRKEKTDWGAVCGGIVIVAIIIAVIANA